MSDFRVNCLLRNMSDIGIMSDMAQISEAGESIPQWTLGDRLRKARKTAGLEQVDMARLLVKSRGAVAGWEAGAHRPDELALRAWAHETNVSLAWIKYGSTMTEPDDGDPAVTGQYRPLALVA